MRKSGSEDALSHHGVGHALEALKAGTIKRAMIIGKGSLFLGRMTNLFDGVSFVIEANPGKEEAAPAVDDTQIRHMIADAMRGFAETLAAQMGE